MKRKLVKQGESTLMVSLPSKWVKQFNVQKGDEVEVQQKDNTIIVSTTLHKQEMEKRLELKELDPYTLQRFLSAMYRVGYDTIHFKYSNPDLIKAIQDVVESQLIGYEIVEQSLNGCTVKNLSGTHESELDSTMRRVFMLLLNISRDCYESVLKQDDAGLRNVQYMDKGVNKFTNYCRRILSVSGHSQFQKTMYYYQLMVEIENISDEYNFLSQYVIENDVKLSNDLSNVFKTINELCEMFYKLFLKFDLHQSNALLLKIGGTTTLINEHFRDKDCDMQVLNYLENITRRISTTLGVLYTINA